MVLGAQCLLRKCLDRVGYTLPSYRKLLYLNRGKSPICWICNLVFPHWFLVNPAFWECVFCLGDQHGNSSSHKHVVNVVYSCFLFLLQLVAACAATHCQLGQTKFCREETCFTGNSARMVHKFIQHVNPSIRTTHQSVPKEIDKLFPVMIHDQLCQWFLTSMVQFCSEGMCLKSSISPMKKTI